MQTLLKSTIAALLLDNVLIEYLDFGFVLLSAMQISGIFPCPDIHLLAI